MPIWPQTNVWYCQVEIGYLPETIQGREFQCGRLFNYELRGNSQTRNRENQRELIQFAIWWDWPRDNPQVPAQLPETAVIHGRRRQGHVRVAGLQQVSCRWADPWGRKRHDISPPTEGAFTKLRGHCRVTALASADKHHQDGCNSTTRRDLSQLREVLGVERWGTGRDAPVPERAQTDHADSVLGLWSREEAVWGDERSNGRREAEGRGGKREDWAGDQEY